MVGDEGEASEADAPEKSPNLPAEPLPIPSPVYQQC